MTSAGRSPAAVAWMLAIILATLATVLIVKEIVLPWLQ